jgi:uncharacterized protein (TIRG00374 family)
MSSRVILKDVVSAIQDTNKLWIFIAVCFYTIGILLRSERWYLLLKNDFIETRFRILRIVIIGYAMNCIFPIKIGEIGRPLLLASKNKIKIPLIVGTVFVERLMDTVILSLLFLFGAVASLDIIIDEFGLKSIAVPLTLILFVLIIFICSIYLNNNSKLMKRKIKLPFVVPNLMNKFHGFIDGITVWKHQGYFFSSIIVTFLSWLLEAMAYWSIGVSFNIDITITQFFLVLWAGTFGFLIPNIGAGIGTFEFFTAGMLIILGLDNSTAAACALVLHGLILFPILILSVPSIIIEKKHINHARENLG